MSINTDYSQSQQVYTANNNNSTSNVNPDPKSTAGQADVAASLFDSTEDKNSNSAAVYESSVGTNGVYKPDQAKVQQMLDEMNNSTNSLKDLVRKMLEKQAEKNAWAYGGSKDDAMGNLMQSIYSSKNGGNGPMVEVDEATRSQAKEMVSEDGYYGVKKTTERIMDFAKALTGGDPSKAEEMRKAVQAGFKQAENMWGGELPQISQDTYDNVMKAFDEWVNPQASQAENEFTNQAAADNLAKDPVGGVNPVGGKN